MEMFVGVECLAVSALAELYEEGIEKISFQKLAEYGLTVMEYYKEESEESAVLIFDPDAIEGLVVNYSDYFDIEVIEGKKYLCMKPQVEIKELKEQFIWTLSYRMLKAISRVNIMDIMNN